MKNSRRWILVLVLVSSMLLGSGCWGRRELEELSFIHLLGVDKGTTERVKLTLMLAISRMSIGGAEQKGFILSGEGWDVSDALNRIEGMSARNITGQHVSCLILGEEFAREDVGPIVDIFSRSMQFRPNTLIAVCQGEASDLIQRAESPEEADPAEYLSKLIIASHETLAACPRVTIHDFSMRYQSIGASPWAPYLAPAAPEPFGAEPIEEAGMGTQRAQERSRCPIAVAGTALFALEGNACRMTGHLDAEETRTALLLEGKPKGWYLDIQSPGDQEVLTIHVRHTSVRVSVDRQDDAVKTDFTIRVSGAVEEFVVSPEAPPTTEEVRKAVNRTAEGRITQLCHEVFGKMMGLGCDGIALGRSVQGTFKTLTEWEEFGWPDKLGTVQATFDVRLEVFSTGFAFQRAYPQ